MKHDVFPIRLSTLVYPLSFVVLIWLIFAIEIRFNLNFNFLGVYPRKIKGLSGVFFSPFIHSNIKHLYSNTFPLLILSLSLFYFYHKIAFKVVIYGVIFSGFLTWLIGRPSFHIGASGVIYVLFSFIFFKGLFAKHYRLIALSLVVVFLYGSMIWYAIPIEEQTSWEGHLSGLITGFVFAIIFRKQIEQPKKYVWEEEHFNEEEDLFLKSFDENGNFVGYEVEEELDESSNNTSDKEQFNYKYHFKSTSKEDNLRH